MTKQSSETGSDAVINLAPLEFRSISRAYWRQPAAYILLIIYVFVEYVRPQSIYQAIEALPLAQVALLATLVASFWMGTANRAIGFQNKMFVVLSIVVLLSSLFAYVPNIAYAQLSLFFTWVLVYFLFTVIINTREQFFLLVLAYTLFNFKMTQHGFFSWAMTGFSFRTWGVTGGPGWFHNSGEFGIQLCVFLPLVCCLVAVVWRYVDWWKKPALLFIPLTGFVSVVATSSRGAVVGIIAAFGWLILTATARVKVLIVAVIIGVGVFFLIPGESLDRFASAGEDNTSTSRIELWNDGLEAMSRYPLLGVGYKNWSTYHQENHPGTEGGTRLVHNIFIEAGTELGYVGLIVFILMIVGAIRLNANTKEYCSQRGDRFGTLMAYGLDAGLIGYLASGFFVTVFYYPYFWFQLAFIVTLNNVSKRDKSNVCIASSLSR